MTLQERWCTWCSAFDVAQDVVDEYWRIIESRYSETQRLYHTLTHLKDMFQHFDDIDKRLSRPELVAMAIFFHDIVYEPREKDNEENSADLFQTFSQIFREQDDKSKRDCSTVFDWIIETKKHETEVHRTLGMFGEDDLHYVLDMDMAILGVPDEEYKRYADDIRREYIHIPEPMFRIGRAKVLRSFIEVSNIYATELFRTQFEERARENIKAEISRLEKGDI